MRSTTRPPRLRADNQAIRYVRALPTCCAPVGDGANRPITLFLFVRFRRVEPILGLLADASGDGYLEQLNSAPKHHQGDDGNHPHFREVMSHAQLVNRNETQHRQADQQPAGQLAPPDIS